MLNDAPPMGILPRMLTARVILAVFALGAALPAAAQAQTPLTPERYAALDRAYTGILPLDARSPSGSDYAAARTACRSMDSADPLLAALRRSCNSTVKFLKTLQTFNGCSSIASCGKRSRPARIAVNRLIRHDRAANKALRSAALVDGCYRELRTTKAELHQLERYRGYFRSFQRLAKTRSPKVARRLLRQENAINRAMGDDRSAADVRSDVRKACAPPAT